MTRISFSSRKQFFFLVISFCCCRFFFLHRILFFFLFPVDESGECVKHVEHNSASEHGTKTDDCNPYTFVETKKKHTHTIGHV